MELSKYVIYIDKSEILSQLVNTVCGVLGFLTLINDRRGKIFLYQKNGDEYRLFSSKSL